MVKILGIDPGLRSLGWGVIQVRGNSYSYCAHGVIQADAKQDMAIRLADIFSELRDVCVAYKPDEAVVEETFVNKNEASALKLGMARGIAMVVPALHQCKVYEYSANKIKKSIVGVGHAEKAQVKQMVKLLLPAADVEQFDAADALAAALCHAHHRDMILKTGT